MLADELLGELLALRLRRFGGRGVLSFEGGQEALVVLRGEARCGHASALWENYTADSAVRFTFEHGKLANADRLPRLNRSDERIHGGLKFFVLLLGSFLPLRCLRFLMFSYFLFARAAMLRRNPDKRRYSSTQRGLILSF